MFFYFNDTETTEMYKYHHTLFHNDALPIYRIENSQAAAVIVINAGNSTQKDVALYLPSDSTDAETTKVEISSPRRFNLRSLFEADPKTSLSKYSQESGFKIPLGNIDRKSTRLNSSH